MNPYAILLYTIERIAYATGIRRVRTIEQLRIERNGGQTSEQLLQRNHEFNDQLEKVADKLEANLT